MGRLTLILSVAVYGLTGFGPCQAQSAFRIQNKASGMVLTVPLRGGPGAVLTQAPLNPADPLQVWIPCHVGNGCYTLVNPATGLALETLRGHKRTPVVLYPLRNVPTQFWHVHQYAGSIHVAFSPALHPDRCLDVPGGRAEPSAIQIYGPNSSAAQQWVPIPVN